MTQGQAEVKKLSHRCLAHHKSHTDSLRSILDNKTNLRNIQTFSSFFMENRAGIAQSIYRDLLRDGRCGDRIPVRGEIFCTRPERPWGPPSLLYNGYRVFPGGKVAGGVVLTTHSLSAPRSRKSTAIPLHPPPPRGPSGVLRGNFTLITSQRTQFVSTRRTNC
jgi:hypothetical protein